MRFKSKHLTVFALWLFCRNRSSKFIARSAICLRTERKKSSAKVNISHNCVVHWWNPRCHFEMINGNHGGFYFLNEKSASEAFDNFDSCLVNEWNRQFSWYFQFFRIIRVIFCRSFRSNLWFQEIESLPSIWRDSPKDNRQYESSC